MKISRLHFVQKNITSVSHPLPHGCDSLKPSWSCLVQEHLAHGNHTLHHHGSGRCHSVPHESDITEVIEWNESSHTLNNVGAILVTVPELSIADSQKISIDIHTSGREG